MTYPSAFTTFESGQVRPLALSPDGTLLAAAGKLNSLVLIDPSNGHVVQTVRLSTGASNTVTAAMSFTGLIFSPAGDRIYLSDAGGTVWAFPVSQPAIGGAHDSTPTARVGRPEVLPVPDAGAPQRKKEIPAGLAISPDGQRLYVVGNLGNRLHELNARTGKVLRSWDTGVAPYDVVLVGSMFNGGALLIDPLRQSIAELAPGARLVRLQTLPVVGAVLLGMEQAHWPITPQLRTELQRTALKRNA